jgi:hypothetical protein
MLRQFKKIFLFLSIIVFLFVVREFIELYVLLRAIHPVWAYLFILLSLGFLYYFAFMPLLKILRMPQGFKPVVDSKDPDSLRVRRMQKFRSNPYLLKSEFDFSQLANDEKGYDTVIKRFENETANIRRKYITNLFYATAIAQNGFIDAILILSANVNMVKEIFVLYNGRVSNRDLLAIGKQVYYSLAIGGSEAIEYAVDETISKLATEGIKGIPFLDKILGSLADGFVNACLLTRVALITENYCKLVSIKSNKELYPSPGVIVSSTRAITSDLYSRVKNVLKELSKRKSEEILSLANYTLNPARYVLEKAISPIAEKTSSSIKYVRSFSLLPLRNAFHKSFAFWKK